MSISRVIEALIRYLFITTLPETFLVLNPYFDFGGLAGRVAGMATFEAFFLPGLDGKYTCPSRFISTTLRKGSRSHSRAHPEHLHPGARELSMIGKGCTPSGKGL